MRFEIEGQQQQKAVKVRLEVDGGTGDLNLIADGKPIVWVEADGEINIVEELPKGFYANPKIYNQ